MIWVYKSNMTFNSLPLATPNDSGSWTWQREQHPGGYQVQAANSQFAESNIRSTSNLHEATAAAATTTAEPTRGLFAGPPGPDCVAAEQLCGHGNGEGAAQSIPQHVAAVEAEPVEVATVRRCQRFRQERRRFGTAK